MFVAGKVGAHGINNEATGKEGKITSGMSRAPSQ